MAHYVVISKSKIFPAPVPKAERFLLKDLGLNLPYMMGQARKFLRELTPTRTGFMRSQVKTWGGRKGVLGGFRFDLGWRAQDFGKKNYPLWVNLGSGVFGRYKTPIVPRKALFLAWQADDGSWRRAKSVRGQKPQYLLVQAFNKWVKWFHNYMEIRRLITYRRTV